MKKKVLVLLALLGIALVSLGVTQERFKYERRLRDNVPYYVEIYEQRDNDLDSTAIVTTARRETIIPDKAAKIAAMTAERQALLDQASALQTRINALSALP